MGHHSEKKSKKKKSSKHHKHHKHHKHRHHSDAKKRNDSDSDSSSSSSANSPPTRSSPSAKNKADESNNKIGCVMPQPLGPALPDFILARMQQGNRDEPKEANPEEINLDSNENDDVGPQPPTIGPAMPENKKRRIGPAMPASAAELEEAARKVAEGAFDNMVEEVELEKRIVAFDEDDEFGPRPEGSRPHAAFLTPAAIRRQQLLAQGNQEDSSVPKREDWMTLLPAERKVGTVDMAARQFSMREKVGRGDTSVWTDTPADRIKKVQTGQQTQDPSNVSYEIDKKQAEKRKLVQEYNQLTRPDSLLDIHQTEQKKVEKTDSDKPISALKHFDREKDMIQRSMKPDDVKRLISSSKELNTRFSGSIS